MTINMASSSVASMVTASTSSTLSSTTELSAEEKLYDLDEDGVLSAEEKAAYMQAQATQKSLEATALNSTSTTETSETSEAASVEISREGLKMQNEKPSEPPPDVKEMSDDGLKSMLSGMKEKNGQLPKELSEYNDTDIEELSSEDLASIRDIMTAKQEERKEKMENNQNSAMSHAISEYIKYGGTAV